jgi:twitching motility protein PilT
MIETGSTLGWHSFDQSLLKAYEAHLISEDTAITFCAHKNRMRRDLDMLKKLGAKTHETPSGMQMREAIVPASSIS